MNLTSNEIITILLFLLPGFVTAAIFFSYTSHLKPSPFERVIQALVFSIINHAAVEVIRLCGRTLHWLSAKLDVVWIHVTVSQVVSIFDLIPNVLLYVAIAVLLGFSAVYITNNDTFHRILRKYKFTVEDSYPSEWYSAFAQSRTYVVLHLIGQRRLYGWPKEWSGNPDNGHLLISECEWLDGDQRIPVQGVDTMLIPVSDVEMVEFVNLNQENQD